MAPGRLLELACEPPLSAKLVDGESGPELVIISSAASLLEGDRLCIDVVLEPGARLVVRSSGAQLAFPCPNGGDTLLEVHADVGAGAQLVWRPEPLIACAGSRHRSRTVVSVADDAHVLWCDELVLGRYSEHPDDVGLVATSSFVRAGVPVLRDGLRLPGTGSTGSAVLGDARYLGTIVELGGGVLCSTDRPPMELAGGGWMLRLLGASAVVRPQLLARLAPDSRPPTR